MPDFTAFAGYYINDTNRPRLRGPAGAKGERVFRSWLADEGQLQSIGRPGRRTVAVHTRVRKRDGFAGDVINGGEAMVAAQGQEGELFAVGGKGQAGGDPARMNELRRLQVSELRGPDLTAVDPDHHRTIGRNRGRVAIGDLAGFSGSSGHPDFLPCAGGVAGGIGKFAAPIGAAAAGEEERGAIRLPGDVVDLLTIVGGELRPRNSLVTRRAGHPNIANALRILHPRNGVAVWGSHQVIGERRAQHLFNAEGRCSIKRDRQKE